MVTVLGKVIVGLNVLMFRSLLVGVTTMLLFDVRSGAKGVIESVSFPTVTSLGVVIVGVSVVRV